MTETITEILERRNPPRRHRSYPRAVKKSQSRYKKRTSGYSGVRHRGPTLVVIRASIPYVAGITGSTRDADQVRC